MHCPHSSSTSYIVPVFLSSVKEPNSPMLYWKHRVTQPLQDLLKERTVNASSVQLTLSTMPAVNTTIASKIAHSLQIRGIHSETHILLNKADSRPSVSNSTSRTNLLLIVVFFQLLPPCMTH